MIDAKELLGVQLSRDRTAIRVRVRDRSGETVSISLPICWLNALLDAMPRSSGPEAVHTLDSWSMDRLGNGHDLVLTLRTPEGEAVSFALKPWQVEGMATIATYGSSGAGSDVTVH